MIHQQTQIKSPKSFGKMIKKYGPGFVALSQKSGRVVASGKTMQEVWEKEKKKKRLKENEVRIRHVPPPNTLLAYGVRPNSL